jgi:hypothetical protein
MQMQLPLTSRFTSSLLKRLLSGLDVAVMRELVGIVTLVLAHYCNSVSDKLIHTVMAWAHAHLGKVCLFDYTLTHPVLVVDAVV